MRRPRFSSPFSPSFWRSPLRGPWFTSVLGIVLLGGITVLFVTGLIAWRRVATMIHVHKDGAMQVYPIDPLALAASLLRDVD